MRVTPQSRAADAPQAGNSPGTAAIRRCRAPAPPLRLAHSQSDATRARPRARPSRARAARCRTGAARCGRSPSRRAARSRARPPPRSRLQPARRVRSARTLISTCGKRRTIVAASASGSWWRPSASSSSTAVIRPSPVVWRSSAITCPDCSPPSTAPCSQHARQHVAVADVGHDGLDAEVAHGAVEAEIRHRRDDDLVARQAAGDLQVARQQRDDLVAVDDRAVRVDGQHAVGVAVEREPEVEAAGAHAARRARRGASSRTRSLMLTPSGSAAVISCSMPSCAKTSGATVEAAPCAQSTSTRSDGTSIGVPPPPGRPGRRSARRRPRAGATRPRPAPVGRAPASLISASTRSSSSSPSLKPSAPKSLMPLSGNGLCEAEMTTPRLAPCSRTSQAMPGVGSTPARSARPPGGRDAGAQRILEHRAPSGACRGRPRSRAGRRRARARTAPRRARARAQPPDRGHRRWRRRARRPFRTAAQPCGEPSASRTAGGAVRP